MAPSANTGETLLDRSQRILGVSLDESEAEKSRTRKSNVSPGRRREQVAQAQRTHRQRTQRYIRELENEVLRLRSREKMTREKNRILQGRLDQMMSTMRLNNLQVPSELGTHSTSPDQLSDFNHDISSHLVNIDITGLSTISPERACSDAAAERSPPDIDVSMLTQNPNVDALQQLEFSANFQSPAGSTEADQTSARLDAQSGVDFILQLEHPCLPHVKYALTHDIDIISPHLRNHNGPGHVFTATASLLQASLMKDPTEYPFSVPQEEISRLLDASKRLNLESELTPVQVWERIKDIAQRQNISSGLLEALTKDCSKYTFCNSFGTVIDKSVADVIFAYHFPSENMQ